MSTPQKYFELIDQETWDFINRTQEFYPPDAVNFSVAVQRQVYDQLCRAFAVAYPPAVKAQDFAISPADHAIPCRRYVCHGREAAAQILYFHGGGFVVGGLHSHDSYCAEICNATGLPLIAVDYRLAPEHIFPADYDDVVCAYRHVIGQSDSPIILMGDSAGGNLAAALAHASRREPIQPIGQVLVYPALGYEHSGGSLIEHANAPMLTKADMDFYASMRTGGKLTLWDKKELSPLNDPDLSGLPPTVVFAAQCDPLRDDGHKYCEKINAAGGKAQFIEETGLVHSYLLARHCLSKAETAFENIVIALTLLSQRRWEPL